MEVKRIATELENRALQDNIINKRLSNKGFNMLCNSLKRFEKETGQKLTIKDVTFLYDYFDLSKFY